MQNAHLISKGDGAVRRISTGLKGAFDGPAAACDEALSCDRPVVLEVKTDPKAPPAGSYLVRTSANIATDAFQGRSRAEPSPKGTARRVFASVLPFREE